MSWVFLSMPHVDFTNLPPFHSPEEILAHPRFPLARGEFVRAMLAPYEHKPFLNRLLTFSKPMSVYHLARMASQSAHLAIRWLGL
jgi:hypothetical protein